MKSQVKGAFYCQNCLQNGVHPGLQSFVQLGQELVCGTCSWKCVEPKPLPIHDELVAVVRNLIESCAFKIGYTACDLPLNQFDQPVSVNRVMFSSRILRDLSCNLDWFTVSDVSKLKKIDGKVYGPNSNELHGQIPAVVDAALRPFARAGFVMTHCDVTSPQRIIWMEKRLQQAGASGDASPLIIRGGFYWF